MDNNAKPSLIERARADLDRVEAQIADLQDKIATLQSDLDDSFASKQKLINAIEVIRSYGEEVGRKESVYNTSYDYPTLDKTNPMYGKSVPEAAILLIKDAGRPLTGKEIVRKMQALGVVFTMPDPVMNANLSLNKRKDLVTRLERGRWAIVGSEFHSEKKGIDTGCVSRASDDDHYEKTLAGLAASKARGVRGGRKPVLVNGKEEKARELLKQGMAPTKVAQVIGISRTTIYRFIEENNVERGAATDAANGADSV